MGASGVNWNNVPHDEILRLINSGAGAAPVNEAAASYRRIAEVLRDADRDLRAALGAAGASWEGRAAQDMATASTPLATWADAADQLAVQTGASTEAFGEQFADTRWSLPAAVSVPAGSWVDGTGLSALPGITTDRERAEEAADTAQQEAARRMEAYDNASYETVQTQYFAEPPAVVLEVPPPAGGGGPGSGGTATAAGGAGSAGGYAAPGGYTAPASAVYQPPAVSGGGAVPGSPTAPAWSPPAPTTPAVTSPPPVGGSRPGGTGPGTPAPAFGAARPDGRKSGSGAPAFPPGLPGRGVPGGPGGFGPGGSGALAGFRDEGFGQRGPAGTGAGGTGAGGLDPEGRAGRAAGTAGGAGLGPVGAGGAGRADDLEHRRPNYLVETEDVWGDGARVAPPVIGDGPPR